MTTEYLVTGQGYEKNDPYKQNIILYDTFNAKDSNDAEKQFNILYTKTHNIIKIYSSIRIDNHD